MKTIRQILRLPNALPVGAAGIIHRSHPGKLARCIRCVPAADGRVFVVTLEWPARNAATLERASTLSREMANARLIASAPDLLAALAGCADALREAGKDFALANPHAVRPNLYELHEQAARAAIDRATGRNAS